MNVYVPHTVQPEFLKIHTIGSNTIEVRLLEDEVKNWSFKLTNEADVDYVNLLMDSSNFDYIDIIVRTKKLPISTKFINIEVTGYLRDSNDTVLINVPIQLIGNIIPIWADTEYMYKTDNQNMNISIEIDGGEVEIYHGKLTKEPNSNFVKKNINSIASNYLDSDFSMFSEGFYKMPNYYKSLTIYNDEDAPQVFNFINSYSYSNKEIDEYVTVISDPIRNIIDNRQWLMCSVFLNEPTKNIPYDTTEVEIDTNGYLDYITGESKNGYTYVGKFPTSEYVGVDTINYEVKQTCYKYCLYYCNAYGGWDSLLIQGNSVKNDEIKSQYYTKSFNNTTHEFENTKYLNLIDTNYTLYTDWFTDEEQSKLYHLLESNHVYLHDLEEDIITPVVITNTNCEWKTFSNNGKKKFYNEIKVKSSQQKIRK